MTADFLFILGDADPVLRSVGEDLSDAVLLVAPVTDALKSVSGGLIQTSVDRESVLAVEGFALSQELANRLGDLPSEPHVLYDAVVALGYAWVQVPSTQYSVPSPKGSTSFGL